MTHGLKGFQKGDLNPSRDPKRRKAISEWRKKQILSETTKKRISHSMKKRLQEPALRKKWSSKQMGVKLSKKTKRKILEVKFKKPKSIKRLKQMADSVFSIYIRKKYADRNGYVRCVTCGRVYFWKELHNGHYVSRIYNSLRYDERNCHPQCVGCNVFKHGALDEYALYLQKKYGNDILEILSIEKRKLHKLTRWELEEIITKYSNKDLIDAPSFITSNTSNKKGIRVEKKETYESNRSIFCCLSYLIYFLYYLSS